MKRKIGIVCVSIIAICVLTFTAKYQIEKSKMVFYHGQSLQTVDSYGYRTFYLDADGNVYISGDVFIQDGWARRVYKHESAPVRIFDQSAREAVALQVGGLIVDEHGNLYYCQSTEPEKIAENCLHPVGDCLDASASQVIVFINTNQQLCKLTEDSDTPVVWMDNILAADCGSCTLKGVLTAEGKLYCWPWGTRERNLTNGILIAENVTSFSTTETVDNSFVYTDKAGNAWLWEENGISVLLAENIEKAAYSPVDDTEILLQKDGTLIAVKDHKTTQLAQNITDLSVTTYFVCAVQDSQTLLFWRENDYGAYANDDSARSVFSYEDEPYRWSAQ